MVVPDHTRLLLLMDLQARSQRQTRWISLGLFHSIHPRIRYQAGMANTVTGAMGKSRPQQKGNQEIDLSTQKRAERDLAAMMIQVYSTELSIDEHQYIKGAQELTKSCKEYSDSQQSSCCGRNSEYSLEGYYTVLIMTAGRWSCPRSCSKRLFLKITMFSWAYIGHAGLNKTVDHVERSQW